MRPIVKQNQAADGTVPISAHSWSRTRGKVVEFSHSWIIENFSFYQAHDVIVSPPFGVGEDSETQWCFKLYPNGKDEANKGQISLDLCLFSCKTTGVPASYKLSVQATRDGVMRSEASNGPQLFIPGQGHGTKFVLGLDKVPFPSDHLPVDNLFVLCDVSALAETSHVFGWGYMELPGSEPDGIPPRKSNSSNSPVRTRLISHGTSRESGISSQGTSGVPNVSPVDSESVSSPEDHDGISPSGDGVPRWPGNHIDDEDRCVCLSDAETCFQNIEKDIANLEVQYVTQRALVDDMIELLKKTTTPQSKNFNEADDEASSSTSPVNLQQQPPDSQRDEPVDDTDEAVQRRLNNLRGLLDELRGVVAGVRRSMELKKLPAEPPKTTRTAEQTLPPDLRRPHASRARGVRSDARFIYPSSSEERESIDVPNPALDYLLRFHGDGDAFSFLQWWIHFKRKVHDRRDLTISQKFECLKSSQVHDANEAIEETANEADDYWSTLRNLFLKYAKDTALPFDLLPVSREVNESPLG